MSDISSKFAALAEDPKTTIPDGGAEALRERLRKAGIEPKPIPIEVAREYMTGKDRAFAKTYNIARGLVEGAVEVAAAPLEAAGQLTGIDALRSAAGGIRSVATIGDAKMRGPGGRMLVEPGLETKFAQAGGSMIGFGAATSLMGRVAGVTGKAGQAVLGSRAAGLTGHAARIGAITEAQSMFRDAEAAGASKGQQYAAFFLGIPVGGLEGLGIGGTGKITRIGEIMSKIDDRSGGVLGKAIMGFPTVLKEGLGEWAQEGTQTFSEKMIAQQILQYAEPEEWDEIWSAVGENAMIGGVLGSGLAQLGLTAEQVSRNRLQNKIIDEFEGNVGKRVLDSAAEVSKGMDPNKDSTGAPRTQASPEEAVARFAESAGIEGGLDFEVVDPEKALDPEAEIPTGEVDLYGRLNNIVGQGGQLPPIVTVDDANAPPGAYVDGVVIINKTFQNEMLAGIALHEILHSKARAGSEEFGRLVAEAKEAFPALTLRMAAMYEDAFIRGERESKWYKDAKKRIEESKTLSAEAKEAALEQLEAKTRPFAALPDGPERTALLIEEGFAHATQHMSLLVDEFISNPESIKPGDVAELKTVLQRIAEWLRNALAKINIGAGGKRSQALAKLDSLLKDQAKRTTQAGAKPEEVVAMAQALARVMREAKIETLPAAPKKGSPDWWRSALPSTPLLPAGPKVERIAERASEREPVIFLGSESRSARLARTKAAQAVNAQGEPIPLPSESPDTKRRRYRDEIAKMEQEVAAEGDPIKRRKPAPEVEPVKKKPTPPRPVTEAEAKGGPPLKAEARRQRYEAHLAKLREERGQAKKPDRTRRDAGPTAAEAAIEDFERGGDRFATLTEKPTAPKKAVRPDIDEKLTPAQPKADATQAATKATATDTDTKKPTVAEMPRTKPDMFGETKERNATRKEVVEDAGLQGQLIQEDTGQRGQASILDEEFQRAPESKPREKPSAATVKAERSLRGRVQLRKKIREVAASEHSTFIHWLRAVGGVSNSGGDLSNFKIKENPAMRRGLPPGFPAAIQPEGKGMSPDMLVRMMIEDGWFAGYTGDTREIEEQLYETENDTDTINRFLEENPTRAEIQEGYVEPDMDPREAEAYQNLKDKGYPRNVADEIMAGEHWGVTPQAAFEDTAPDYSLEMEPPETFFPSDPAIEDFERGIDRFATSGGKDRVYEYALTRRPAASFTVPKGFASINPASKTWPFGTVTFTKPLSRDAIESFELEPLDPLDPIRLRRAFEARRKIMMNALLDSPTESLQLVSRGSSAYPALLAPSAQNDGYQLTWFDSNTMEPTGHLEFQDIPDALDHVARAYELKTLATDTRFATSPTIEVDGQERHRLNSDGKPIATTDEALRNFWRWFGDSEIVDDQGRPLVVYHGTKSAFTVFDLELAGRSDAGLVGQGIYLATAPETASMFADHFSFGEGGPAVMPHYAAISNPFVYRDGVGPNGERLGDWFGNKVFYSNIKEQGYDGVLLYLDGRLEQVVAFEPTQIKSATGNRGTFSPTDPDIRRAAAPTIEVDGQERHRLNSDGKPIAGTDEALRNFWRWFGESKVVDEQGRPIASVHYTGNSFTAFLHEAQREAQWAGRGFTTAYGRTRVFPGRGFFFFTPHPSYVGGQVPPVPGQVDRAMSAYLSIQNPLDLRKGLTGAQASLVIDLVKAKVESEPTPGMWGFRINGATVGGLRRARRDGVSGEQLFNFLSEYMWGFRPQQWNDVLKALGADGLIMEANSAGTSTLEPERGPGDGETYLVAVALAPTQIKSATGNRGTFSPTDPDIRRATAPEEEDIPLVNLGKGALLKGVRARQKWLTSRGLLPQSAFDAMLSRDFKVGELNQQLQFDARDFRKALKEVGGMTRGLEKDLDAALRDERLVDRLPEPLREPVLKMRRAVDALSLALLESGAVEGPVEATIRANMGFYLTRSFQAFDDPDWAKKVPEEVRNRAKAFLRAEFAKIGEPNTDVDAWIKNYLFEAAKSKSPIAWLANGKLGSKDLSILKRRKRIAPEIRALLGEYTDPLVNYARSVSKMTFLIANHQFLSEARAAGLDEGYFSEEVRGDTIAKIAADESSVLAPLNGLYTTPDVLEAFTDATSPQVAGQLLQLYMKANSAVKMGKTVGSAQTHVRNVVGNVGFAVAQGHWNLACTPEALGGFLAGLGISSRADFRKVILEARSYGVTHESAHAGELYDILTEALGGDLNDIATSHIKKSLARRTVDVLTALYMAEDDFWKLLAWGIERQRYAKAYPDWTDAQVKERAAKIVRNTFPTYSLVPRGVKAIRYIPLIGAFTSFPAEVVRVGWNTAHLIKSELADPKTRSIGAQRLAGSLAASLSTTLAALATAFYFGYDDDDREAMREFVPEYSKSHDLVMLGPDKDNKPRYIDISYTDPWSYLKNPINALLRGDSVSEGVFDALKEVAAPFLGEEILAGALMNVRSNQTEAGGSKKVYNDAAPLWTQGKQIAEYLWNKALEPGTVTSVKRIKKGLEGYVSPSGKEYDTEDEVLALVLGQRRSTIDAQQGLIFKARDFSTDTSNANKILSSVASRRGVVDDDEIRDAVVGMEQQRRKIFEDLQKAIKAARQLKVPDPVIADQLEASGVSNYLVRSAIRGVYEPYRVTPSFLQGYESGQSSERIGEIRRRRSLVEDILSELDQ